MAELVKTSGQGRVRRSDPEAQARYEQARRSLLNPLQASANLVKPESGG